MKRKKLILLFILLVFMIFGTFNWNMMVNAEEQTGCFVKQNGVVSDTLGGYDVQAPNFLVNIDIDGYVLRDDLNNNRGWCAEWYQVAPGRNVEFRANVVKPGDSNYKREIAAALYYGYDGKKNKLTEYSMESQFLATWSVLSKLYCGEASYQVSGNSANKVNEAYNDLMGVANNPPDLPDGTAYLVLSPISKPSQEVLAEHADTKPPASGYQTIITLLEPQNGNAELRKSLQATDNDAKISLAGASFRATLKTDPSKQFDFVDNGNGVYSLKNVPAGTYNVEEVVAPPAALKVPNFDIEVKAGVTIPVAVEVEDKSKKIKIEIVKSISDGLAGKTDATLAGAYFTVYTDASCTAPYKNKNGETVVIGPTDESGYAISGTMRTGTYYLKETTFPVGMNPDAIIPGENISYREKVYNVIANNETQTTEVETISVILEDKPINGHFKIYKTLQESDYDEPIPLEGAQFTIKLKGAIGTVNEQAATYLTNVSGEDGICEYKNLPYGTYTVEETIVPDSALKVDNFEFSVTEDDKTYTFGNEKGTIQECEDGQKLIDISKKMKIVVRKQDYDADIYDKDKEGSYFWTQGDATFVGAEYTIYRDRGLTDVVDTITIDHQNAEGYWCAESDYMWTGTYYVKETKRPKGYLIDENVYTFSQNPATQVEEKITIEKALENGGRSTEKVERGKVTVDKFDNKSDKTEEAPAHNAVLWLVLDSSVPGGAEGKSSSQIVELAETNDIIYYETKVDENGDAEFIDKIYRAKYPDAEYTIPYGKYTIIEVAGSEKGAKTHFFNEPQDVEITRQTEERHYIIGEEKITFYLQIQKMDADINKEVHIPGAVFRVWDVVNEKYVEQKDPQLGKETKDFVTNDDGKVTLPQKIDAGEYIIYEITPPSGYYSNDEYRLDPENEGVIGKGGKYVVIDKEAMGIEPDSTGEEVDLYYKAEIPNTSFKGKLQIIKTGEKLTGVKQETYDTYTNTTDKYKQKYTVTSPVYSEKGLEGAEFKIYAAEDIKTPDEENQYIANGTLVATITTNSEGIAETQDLYLGKYRIVETKTPKGYTTNVNIEDVTLTNKGPEKVKVTSEQIENERQKLTITLDKLFDEIEYSNGTNIKRNAVFGVYTNDNFTWADKVIAKDTLVGRIEVIDGVVQDTSDIDLPEGNYYVKELESVYPYTVGDQVKEVELSYKNTQEKVVKFSAGEFKNTIETKNVTLIKLSTSTLKDVILSGNEIDTSKLDEEVQELLKEFSGKTTEEIREYLKERQVKFVAGAKYGVYVDENCTEPLYMKNADGQFVAAIMETDETGLITMEKVPLGTYYFKEIEAPKGYELSNEVVKLELNLDSKDAVVYQALIEEPVLGRGLIKTDAFTGEYVDNCEFEVRDAETNEVIVHSITGTFHDDTNLRKDGVGYIPLDKLIEGRKYTFTEISAPNIYDLNKDPHEFTAHFDENGNWDVKPIEVENRRKVTELTFEKTDFADSTPIPNCKFELRSLETDFVVEGVTDENGKYVFKDIPYGKYTYRELEAPEEYMIDTEEHEIEINTEKTTIKITNEKAPELPDTSDIAVYTLCAVALVSIFGIVYAIKRKK